MTFTIHTTYTDNNNVEQKVTKMNYTKVLFAIYTILHASPSQISHQDCLIIAFYIRGRKIEKQHNYKDLVCKHNRVRDRIKINPELLVIR